MYTRRPIYTLQCLIYIPVTNVVLATLGGCFSIEGWVRSKHLNDVCYTSMCMSINVHILFAGCTTRRQRCTYATALLPVSTVCTCSKITIYFPYNTSFIPLSHVAKNTQRSVTVTIVRVYWSSWVHLVSVETWEGVLDLTAKENCQIMLKTTIFVRDTNNCHKYTIRLLTNTVY